MNDIIKASVFRFDPQTDSEPYYVDYEIKSAEEMSVLMLLKIIQAECDPTLGFRHYCCGLQMCRSCLMKIDKKKKFACLTIVKPGDKIVIDPLSFPEAHIKDLVIKNMNKD